MDWLLTLGRDVLLVVLGGGGFKFAEYLIERKTQLKIRKEDKAEEKDKTLQLLKDELREEFKIGLEESEQKNAEKFKTNSDAIDANTKAIGELIELNKSLTEKVDTLADSVKTSFDAIDKKVEYQSNGLKSVLYGQISDIYDRCLSRCDGGAITSDEEANLEQLYESYSGLGGNGRGHKMYEKACEMHTVTKEQAHELDQKKVKHDKNE